MQPHKLDPVSLISGLIFLAVGVGHLLGLNVWRMWGGVDVLLPILLIIIGAALLLRARRRPRDDEIA